MGKAEKVLCRAESQGLQKTAVFAAMAMSGSEAGKGGCRKGSLQKKACNIMGVIVIFIV